MSFNPFHTISGDENQALLLIADHAMAYLPDHYASLGLPQSAFSTHIAYDIGVEALTRALAARLNVPAVMAGFSRLLIDPNRGEDDPTLIMQISDGTIIEGNYPLEAHERQRRIETYYRPYHDEIARKIEHIEQVSGKAPLVISLHSYTPIWRGSPRPWHAGILWDNDPRAPVAFLCGLRSIDGLVIGDNEPYDGALKNDTLNRHCTVQGLANALIEIRQDLLVDADNVALWAERLAAICETLNQQDDVHVRRDFSTRTHRHDF